MRRFVLLLALVMAGVVAGTSGGATSADTVTMSVRQYINPNKVRTLAFSGQISSGAAGELVTLLGRDCVGPGLRQIAAAQTGGGGIWQVETPSPQQAYVEIFSGTTIRAHWKNAESAPFLYRVGLIPYPLQLKRGVVTVNVNPSPLNLKLAGKQVALQRFRANAWQPYLQASPEVQADPRSRRLQPRGDVQGQARPEAARARADRERTTLLPRRSVEAVHVVTLHRPR